MLCYLSELVRRWLDGGKRFRVRCHVIPFTPLDVCFALSLCICGQLVSFKDDEECVVKCLFKEEDIMLKTTVEILCKL